MARVLVIDDQENALEFVRRVVALHGHEFQGATSGSAGLDLAHQWQPDVALVDLRLRDMSGLDVLEQLEADCPATARVIFSGYATRDATIEGMRHGACDCVVKPASIEALSAAIERGIVRRAQLLELSPPPSQIEPHAATRWAEPVVKAIDAARDPRTLKMFWKPTGISVGCFRNWCRTLRIGPRESLEFARGLRAVALFEEKRATRPEFALDIVDTRTIVKFVKKCGGEADRLPDSVERFLELQQFVTDPEVISAVRTTLRNRRNRTA